MASTPRKQGGPAEIRTRDFTPKTPLPHVEPLGRVSPRFCKLYSREYGVFLKAHADNGGITPTLYIDLEHTPEWGTELHLAVTGGYRKEEVRESQVKLDTRDDWYIPRTEIPKILWAITQANLRRAKQ